MKRCYQYALFLPIAAVIGGLAYFAYDAPAGPSAPTEKLPLLSRPPAIHPDYSGIVIPPNIAPLNFLVREQGVQYCVRIHGPKGKQIEASCRSGKIRIPRRPWRRLLSANIGQQIKIDVLVRNEQGNWRRFQTITNTIAQEPIDQYLVYRRIHPGHNAWNKIGIYQRNLSSFDESLVLDNSYFSQGCLNCHTFCNNKTDKMLIGIRSYKYGSNALLVQDGKAKKIDTKFGYTAWHPSGKLATYSINQVNQFFHTSQTEVRDVVDLNSLLAYYVLDTGEAKTIPRIAKKERLETYPAWSADGRHLYFCSAPLTWTRFDIIPPNYNEIKYDLMRISYDVAADKWGELETILAAKDTGKSILLPRISPDGRWLLFCMCDYGCFPVYRASSDLYIIDLQSITPGRSPKCRRLEVNSDQSESWHSFSANSRWIAFSSKRDSNPFTRSYLAYVETEGDVHKAFVVPQKDPTHYDGCLWTYSVPELIIEPVKVTKERLGRVVRGSQKDSVDFPITRATPKPGQKTDKPWFTERE